MANKLIIPLFLISPEETYSFSFQVKDNEMKGWVVNYCKKVGLDVKSEGLLMTVQGLGGFLRQVAESWAKDKLVLFEDPHTWVDRNFPYEKMLEITKEESKPLIDKYCHLLGNNYWWMVYDYANIQHWETHWNANRKYMTHTHHGCGGSIVEIHTDYVCTLQCVKCKQRWMI
jgi:hypothetical protein